MATTTEMFNEKSRGHSHSRHRLLMAGHTVLMLGMVLGAVALTGPAGAATMGDLALQSLYVVKDMAVGLVSNLDVLADIAGNTLEGNFAPNTWDAAMSHGAMGAEHALHGAAGHGVHAGTGLFDQWMSALSPEEISGIQSDLQGPLGGMSMREYFELNFSHGMHVK
jgi:hypothetical protein